ncbi:MAG: hypothetical protein RLZZ511_2771 [Cyanobacteriota bacterium]
MPSITRPIKDGLEQFLVGFFIPEDPGEIFNFLEGKDFVVEDDVF